MNTLHRRLNKNMLVYHNSGVTDYNANPVPVIDRPVWEFQCCLSGTVAPRFPGDITGTSIQAPAIWVFPRFHRHGWVAEKPAERIVFHFTEVPKELDTLVPSRGYYQEALSFEESHRVRCIADHAATIMTRPTQLSSLKSQGLLIELSLLAIKMITFAPVPCARLAHEKVEQALAWYREHTDQGPSLDRVAAAVHVSPSSLRRMFRKVAMGSPSEEFNRIRMKMAEDLLTTTSMTLDAMAPQVGFSSASALSRAITTHFGISPRAVRHWNSEVS